MPITKKAIKRLEDMACIRQEDKTRLTILQETALKERSRELLDQLFEDISQETIDDLMESYHRNLYYFSKPDETDPTIPIS
jgi:hypothetical protein